jgi:regulator of sirC expression with transglutaminase-like and TPR domain
MLRQKRRYARSARTLERLLELHPNSIEAEHGQLALADLQLEHLHRPLAALQSYNRYLARSGATSFEREAMLGRARALRATGRNEEERAALRAFLSRFPAALEVEQIEERLRELHGEQSR